MGTTGGQRLRRARRRAVSVLVVAVLAACGGGDDEATDDTVALEDIEPIVDIDPCELIDDDTASQLSGAEVEAAESTTEDDGTTACEFAFAEEDDAETAGSAIAASLRIGPGDESDIPGGGLARSLSIGDAAAVEEEEQRVRVVYIVREVVVRVEVAPSSGEVTPELVDAVIEFTETTEAPVTEAVTGEPFEPTTTTGDTTTTTFVDEELPEGEAIEVDGPDVTAEVDRAGGVATFVFEAEAGDVVFVDVLAATRQPVDSSDCLQVSILDPQDFTINAACAQADGSAFIDRTELELDGVYQVVFDPGGPVTGSAVLRLTSATDQEGTVTVDGDTVTATVGQPGAIATFTFAGSAGDAIFVSIPAADRQPVDSTDCLQVRVLDPDDFTINAACAQSDGSAFIDRTELVTTGTHQIVFDPGGRVTGSVQIQVTDAG